MQRESLWEQYVLPKNNKIKQLQGDIRTDVLIIGAGVAGILCALKLKEAGVSCVVVEKGKMLEGVTRNTTAKITAQHGLIYNSISKTYGLERARQYYDINNIALEEYKKIAHIIPCDLEIKNAYVYSRENRQKLEKESMLYEKIGISYEWREKIPFSISTCGALGMLNQAQFNPAKMLLELAKQVDVYENARALDIKGNTVTIEQSILKNQRTENITAKINANQIILTTHFPMINIFGGYFAKMYQHRSYVVAIKEGPQIDGMYLDENKKGHSFRNYKDYLLIGGGSHKTGAKGGGFLELEMFAQKEYPHKKIAYAWATQDCMSLDGIPYIGLHSRSHSNMYVATGFNKWGMTGAMSSAIVLKDLITKGESQYQKLFSPSRAITHPQLLVNLSSAVGNILRPGRRCTHMGCSLRWNAEERSWDCPCHGSRYSENGIVLENPAKKDKTNLQ